MAEEVHENHGHSVAAWTAVILLIVASVFVSLGVAFGWHVCTWLGVVFVVLGVAAGKILAKMGFGNKDIVTAPPVPGSGGQRVTSDQRAS